MWKGSIQIILLPVIPNQLVTNSVQIHIQELRQSQFFHSELCTFLRAKSVCVCSSLHLCTRSLPLSYFQEDAAGLDDPRMKLVQRGFSSGVCSCGRTWTDAFIGQPFSCSHQEKGMTNSTGSCTWRLQTQRSNSLHERLLDLFSQICVWMHTQNILAHY